MTEHLSLQADLKTKWHFWKQLHKVSQRTGTLGNRLPSSGPLWAAAVGRWEETVLVSFCCHESEGTLRSWACKLAFRLWRDLLLPSFPQVLTVLLKFRQRAVLKAQGLCFHFPRNSNLPRPTPKSFLCFQGDLTSEDSHEHLCSRHWLA